MQISTFALSVGLGMAAGATVAALLPKNPKFKKAVNQAADSIEGAVEDAKDFVCGK